MKSLTSCIFVALALSSASSSVHAADYSNLDTIGKCDPQVSAYHEKLQSEKYQNRFDHMRHDMELAVLNNDYSRVSSLLNTWKHKESAIDVSDALQSGLSMAAWSGNDRMTDLLIKDGARPNEWTNHTLGIPAIVLAAGCGHMNVVSAIIRDGGDIGAKSDTGVSALEAAMNGIHEDVAEWILSRGFNVCEIESRDKIARMKSIAKRFHMRQSLIDDLGCKLNSSTDAR